MQPPPRKVKDSQQVKLLFSEQLTRLQSRQHLDTELLEEISAFGIWRSILDASTRSAAARLAAAEEYRSLLGETSRAPRCVKDVRAKRGLEQLHRVQGEVVEAIRELHRVRKRYHHLGHIAHVARDKAAEAQARVRRSDHGLFHFRTGLQKMTAKLEEEEEENPQHKHLTRERNVQHFLQEALPFSATLRLAFQPAARDVVGVLQEVCGAGEESALNKEATRWASKVAKDYKIISHGTREEEFDLTDLEEFEDGEEGEGDIFVDASSASVVCLYPAACRVVYDYQASQSDELSIAEGEELQVCNSCGQVGYVPERYVEFLCLPAEDAVRLDCSFGSCISIGNIRSGHTLVVELLTEEEEEEEEEEEDEEGSVEEKTPFYYLGWLSQWTRCSLCPLEARTGTAIALETRLDRSGLPHRAGRKGTPEKHRAMYLLRIRLVACRVVTPQRPDCRTFLPHEVKCCVGRFGKNLEKGPRKGFGRVTGRGCCIQGQRRGGRAG
ncbi:hypothetical protein CRUP_009758 [Coryphaenoides rupestris]|nr:hypothetical protein CRUP_009758 [Coryphaenoides rupestris]